MTDMLFLSQLMNGPIRNHRGERIATVRDLVARSGNVHPPISGIVARQGRRDFFVPADHVAAIGPAGITLATNAVTLTPFERRDGEILLGRDVLDRQIIDINGRRVVRVNDLQIAPVEGAYRLIGVDIGARALLKRLGFRRRGERGPLGDLVDWADIEYLAANAPVRLRVSHQGVARLHPAEIANIIEDLSYHKGSEIVSALDDETAADTLEELDDERQAEILEQMDAGRAADILEEMAPDDAADILADLPQEKQDELLALMEPEDSDDVRELLEYHEDTAGGVMTTDYIAVPLAMTAARGALHPKSLHLGLPGLEEGPRTGRPPVYAPMDVGMVIQISLTPPDELNLPFGSWTLDRLVAYLGEVKGIAIRRSRISEILRQEGLRWRHQEGWFGERIDPDFAAKRGRSRPSTPPPPSAV